MFPFDRIVYAYDTAPWQKSITDNGSQEITNTYVHVSYALLLLVISMYTDSSGYGDHIIPARINFPTSFSVSIININQMSFNIRLNTEKLKMRTRLKSKNRLIFDTLLKVIIFAHVVLLNVDDMSHIE